MGPFRHAGVLRGGIVVLQAATVNVGATTALTFTVKPDNITDKYYG
ncbi:hypothetical protein KY538_004596 [Salmonella enterica]|nr:hypothetical protein [Salmonella enterica]ELG4337700.1 hypothetical protein [Salmonella enterica]ELX2807994.1 hypothetical protein [Salmonella enterica]